MKLIPPVEKNDDIELRIDALGSEGQGIGRINGYTLFVPFALPGELVRAHVIKVTSGYAVAKLISVLEASQNRVKSMDCGAYPQCGGCTLRHMEYTAQLEAKQNQVKEAFARIGGFREIEVLPTKGMDVPENYRNKGSFPFGYDGEGNISIGFFAPRSHRLIPLEDCLIQSDSVMETVIAMRDWARENSVAPYDETTRKGILRHALARVSDDGKVLAMIVTSGKLPHEKELVDTLRQRVDGLVGVVHNINDSGTNVILGKKSRTVWGSDRLITDVCGHSFNVSMHSFLQVNPLQTSVLYNTAIDMLELDGSENAADVYCGIGTISLLLAKKAKKVVGIECVKEAIEDAKMNAAKNGVVNAEFICANAEDALPRLVAEGLRLDAAVIDPPRKGCEEAALNALANSGVKKIAYVSCNPATLARDCRILADFGYEVKKVQPVDMFPHTHHVETVVLMTRQ